MDLLVAAALPPLDATLLGGATVPPFPMLAIALSWPTGRSDLLGLA